MVTEGLLRRLTRLHRALKRLKMLRSEARESILASEDKLDILENNLRIAIEALLDIGRYIISKEEWEPPSSYREVATILYRHSVIDAKEKLLLESLAGLRNVIVHLYADVDYERLVEALDIVDDIENLVNKMLKYIEEHRIDP